MNDYRVILKSDRPFSQLKTGYTHQSHPSNILLHTTPEYLHGDQGSIKQPEK